MYLKSKKIILFYSFIREIKKSLVVFKHFQFDFFENWHFLNKLEFFLRIQEFSYLMYYRLKQNYCEPHLFWA